MKKVIRKAVLFGMGVVSLTKEKIEDFVKDLEKEGKITHKEGKKMVKEFMEVAKKQQERFVRTVRDQVKGVLKEMPLATKSDLKALERKLKKPAKKAKKKGKRK